MNGPTGVFAKPDRFAALVAGSLALVLYVFTAAPNVTLLDSGEFIVAAQHFGVPHPTGYPLWTISAWLMTLLPLGNAAWEVNLFSGLCSALAVAVFAGLGSSLLRWFFAPLGLSDRWSALLGGAFALAAGCSVPVWSQAVIAEVYGLHALLTGCQVAALYVWVREGDRWRGFLAALFFFALGMSNHHLTLSLAPIPVVLLLLVRPGAAAEVLLYLGIIGAAVFWGFGLISGEPPTLDASVRTVLCALLVAALFRLFRGRFVHGRLLPRMALAVFLGLLPHVYMPLASSTNPPMNWSYARTRDGFFYAINRSQYQGTLSSQLLRSVGRVVGATPRETDPAPQAGEGSGEPSRFQAFALFSTMYWGKLTSSLSPALLVPFLMAFTALRLLERRQRAMLLAGYLAFFLAAFFQPLFDRASDDLSGWLLQMPYHGYAFLLFALLCAIGAARLQLLCAGRLARLGAIRFLWLAIPGWALLVNASACNQRGHWFGWEYGAGMVGPLPRDAVLFGGTDPGRFVPTYMIFGESPQPARHKRDPGFDRRDVYIITQNALVDPYYQRYIHDHYGPARPRPRGIWERWLGRAALYPRNPLDLPGDPEIRGAIQAELEAAERKGELGEVSGDSSRLNAAVAKQIWERNKGRHRFFVEESFPMEWSYPYAIPRGLVYEIAPDPLDALPGEAVAADREFWSDLVRRFLADPAFLRDVDARRSFSKLRNTGGNLYRHRKLLDEAELAYRQAIELWPASGESLSALCEILTDAGRHGEALELLARGQGIDPRSRSLAQLRQLVLARRALAAEIRVLEESRRAAPRNRDVFIELLQNYQVTRRFDAADALIRDGLGAFESDPVVLQECINHRVVRMQWSEGLELARKWDALDPKNPEVKFMLAKFLHATGAMPEFYAAAREAIRLGGIPLRERFAAEPLYRPLRAEPQFRALLDAGLPGLPDLPSGGAPPGP